MSTEQKKDLVTLTIGFDRWQADLIMARCRAENLDAHFLQMDENGLSPGLVALIPHKVLVARRDAARVEAIMQQIQDSPDETPSEPNRFQRLLRRILGG